MDSLKIFVSAMRLKELAYEILHGYGDAELGEWLEQSQQLKAFHLRRRLAKDEELRVGPPVDCRATAEAQARYNAIKNFLPYSVLPMVREEVPGIVL